MMTWNDPMTGFTHAACNLPGVTCELILTGEGQEAFYANGEVVCVRDDGTWRYVDQHGAPRLDQPVTDQWVIAMLNELVRQAEQSSVTPTNGK